jgi:hypothetical protein
VACIYSSCVSLFPTNHQLQLPFLTSTAGPSSRWRRPSQNHEDLYMFLIAGPSCLWRRPFSHHSSASLGHLIAGPSCLWRLPFSHHSSPPFLDSIAGPSSRWRLPFNHHSSLSFTTFIVACERGPEDMSRNIICPLLDKTIPSIYRQKLVSDIMDLPQLTHKCSSCEETIYSGFTPVLNIHGHLHLSDCGGTLMSPGSFQCECNKSVQRAIRFHLCNQKNDV